MLQFRLLIYQNMTRNEFMEFFRNNESLNQLTPDDRLEIFSTILLGSSDFSEPLFEKLFNDYGLENLYVLE